MLAARIEPFDSYWQAPEDVEAGYRRFSAYYRHNYLTHLPKQKDASILVISCGPGYLVDLLKSEGYENVIGIDSDEGKIEFARKRDLNCHVARAFEFLQSEEPENFDVIIPEQELSHLTHEETIIFLRLCRERLKKGGKLVVYALNGANPLVGSENLAHNIDHFYTVTEYSLNQLLELGGFREIKIYPLKLYVFWKNPLNYVGLVATIIIELFFRGIFVLYGKNVKVLTKKILATCIR
jgi:SAM-dependent methyltransferase